MKAALTTVAKLIAVGLLAFVASVCTTGCGAPLQELREVAKTAREAEPVVLEGRECSLLTCIRESKSEDDIRACVDKAKARWDKLHELFQALRMVHCRVDPRAVGCPGAAAPSLAPTADPDGV